MIIGKTGLPFSDLNHITNEIKKYIDRHVSVLGGLKEGGASSHACGL